MGSNPARNDILYSFFFPQDIYQLLSFYQSVNLSDTQCQKI